MRTSDRKDKYIALLYIVVTVLWRCCERTYLSSIWSASYKTNKYWYK